MHTIRRTARLALASAATGIAASAAPVVPTAVNPAGPVAQRDAKLRSAGIPSAPMIAVSQAFDDPVPAAAADARLDLVTLMFNYHDLGFMGVDRARMNRAI